MAKRKSLVCNCNLVGFFVKSEMRGIEMTDILLWLIIMSMYYLIFTDVKFIKLSQHALLLNDCLMMLNVYFIT